MKILYTAMLGVLDNAIGVVNKISQQSQAMTKQEQHVETIIYFHTDNNNISEKVEFSNINFIKLDRGSSLIEKILYRKKAYGDIEYRISKSKCDVVYFRYSFADIFLLNMMRKFGSKVIFEHQSHEINELRDGRKLSFDYYSERLFGKKVRSLAKGAIGVTKDVSNHQIKRYKNYNINTVSNGINVNQYSIKKRNDIINEINFLVVANVSKWHGIDRFIKSMNEYTGDKKIYLHVVGEGKEIPFLKDLTTNLNMQDSVVFHGRLTGGKLLEIYEKSHIGIASLGMHRINLYEAATLKVREYFSIGIPFIIGYDDIDLIHNNNLNNYFYSIPNDDSIFPLEQIITFFDTGNNSSERSKTMHELAFTYFDVSIKIQQLLDSINKMMKKDGSV